MFRKSKGMNPNETDTLIGEGSSVEGKVISKASLRIEGKVHGDIVCEGDVTIGEKGMVNSNIIARNVYTAGQVEGSVTSKGTLKITNTGKVFGNIHVKSLSIAEGGVFQGMSRMAGKQEAVSDHAADDKDQHNSNRKTHLHKVEKEAVAK